MTHNRDHIVIHQFRASVGFTKDSRPGKLEVWHVALGLVLLGVVAGAWMA